MPQQERTLFHVIDNIEISSMDDSSRFDWFDSVKIVPLETMASKVISVIDQGRSTKNQSISQIRTHQETELHVVNRLLSALYQSYFTMPVGTFKVSIPTSSKSYSKTVDARLPLGSPYRPVRRVLEALKKLDWVEYYPGNTYKGVTRICASNELARQFENIGLQWSPQIPKDPSSLVILRDRIRPDSKEKIDLPVPCTPEVLASREFLFRYNSFLIDHCVALDLTDAQLQVLAGLVTDFKLALTRKQIRRIFSRGSTSKGGRLYNGWWQGVPSLYRPHITIDGYRTTEIDYSSMALRIIYAEQGLQVQSDGDLYDIGLPDWTGSGDPRRKLIKEYINALLNDESGRYHLNLEDQQKLGISRKELLRLVKNKHAAIEHLFYSGVGLDAQFVDSEIAIKVLKNLMDQDILALPIHDSFIVRTGFRADLFDAMNAAFSEVTKTQTSLDETGPSLRELFGLKLSETDIEDRSSVITLDKGFDHLLQYPRGLMHKFVTSWRQQRR